MRNIMRKELKLSAALITYCFIAFGLMFFLPGYPTLCGAFFSCLGVFQGFSYAREANDIIFSALLPVAKRDVVKGKYAFVCFIEVCTVLVMCIPVILRMTVFADSIVYRSNFMMNANLFALGAAFVMFGIFNVIFLGGFFKTSYKLGKPFIIFSIAGFFTIGIFEALHHVPGLAMLNAFGFDHLKLQLLLLCAGILVYILMTVLSCRRACVNFENTDL